MSTANAPELVHLSPPQRLLLGPGPSNVHRRVYRALSTPVVGHLDPSFIEIMDRLQEMLRRVFRTDNRVTLPISGTGSAGMEAAFVNLVEPGEGVLVGVNGVFGMRMADVVERIGGKLVRIERPWGEVFDPQEIADALDRHPNVRTVAIVHAETSTGAAQPIADIGSMCREREKFLIVDTVTSLGGMDVRVDEWGIDVCYSGTQKCLSCPPGLAPITFSERAVEKARRRQSKGVSWYLDLNLIDSYWSEGKRVYHHTAPISMNYALHEALALLLQNGLQETFVRHRVNHQALVAGLEATGLQMLIEDPNRRLPMLNSVRVPEGADEPAIRRQLLDRYNIEIGAGLGPLAGKVWRIGLMGESSRRENVLFVLQCLGLTLGELGLVDGAEGTVGPAVEAAASEYARSPAIG